jgi:Flp pilus assembly protein TadG
MNLLTKLISFRKCRAGNVSLLFAGAIFPIVGTIGLAVDYSRANEVKSQMTTAVDAAALALAHSSVNLTDAELQKKAKALFDANFKPGTAAEAATVHAARDQGVLTVDASSRLNTLFMRVLNYDKLPIDAKTKVVWGSKQKIEVVLALDNTGSMKDKIGSTNVTKMDELKKAAKELVDTLEASQLPGTTNQVKIGIVPFATSVRVDPTSNTYKTADWIRFDKITEQKCELKKVNGDWKYECKDVTRDFSKTAWQGCILDRDQSNDVSDAEAKTAKSETLYPAAETCPSSESKLQLVQPLTTDFNKLRTVISNMEPAGNTNVTIGVSWGMALLSSQKPFTEGSSVTTGDAAVKKFLIILTDGENTKNRFTTSTSAIDARTTLACKAAHDMGTIFSIRMIEGNATLLKACASDPDNYHDIQAATELTTAFRAIGNEIGGLRIAQ